MNYSKRLISIGNSCRTRYQLDVFQQRTTPNYVKESFFFDWLVGGNLTGVINLLERNLLITADDISVGFRDGKGYIPTETSSGFIFLHDFGSKHTFFKTADECEQAITKDFDLSLAKYAYLREKTLSTLATDPVVLVYEGVQPATLWTRLQKIVQERWGSHVQLMNIVSLHEVHPVSDGSVVNAFVDEANSPKKNLPSDWQGFDDSWSLALSSILNHR